MPISTDLKRSLEAQRTVIPISKRNAITRASCVGYKNKPCPSHCVQRKRTKGALYNYCYPIRKWVVDTEPAGSHHNPSTQEAYRPLTARYGVYSQQMGTTRTYRPLTARYGLYSQQTETARAYRPLASRYGLYSHQTGTARANRLLDTRYDLYSKQTSTTIAYPQPHTASELVVVRKKSRSTDISSQAPRNTAYPRVYMYVARAQRSGMARTDADEVARIVNDPTVSVTSKISGVCKALGTNAMAQINGWITNNWKPILFGTAMSTAIGVGAILAVPGLLTWGGLLSGLQFAGATAMPSGLLTSGVLPAGLKYAAMTTLGRALTSATTSTAVSGVVRVSLASFLSQCRQTETGKWWLGLRVPDAVVNQARRFMTIRKGDRVEDILPCAAHTVLMTLFSGMTTESASHFFVSQAMSTGIVLLNRARQRATKANLKQTIQTLSSHAQNVANHMTDRIFSPSPDESVSPSSVSVVTAMNQQPLVRHPFHQPLARVETSSAIDTTRGDALYFASRTAFASTMLGLATAYNPTLALEDVIMGTISQFALGSVTSAVVDRVGVRRLIDRMSEHLSEKKQKKIRKLADQYRKERSLPVAYKLLARLIGPMHTADALKTMGRAELKRACKIANIRTHTGVTKEQMRVSLAQMQMDRYGRVHSSLMEGFTDTIRAATTNVISSTVASQGVSAFAKSRQFITKTLADTMSETATREKHMQALVHKWLSTARDATREAYQRTTESIVAAAGYSYDQAQKQAVGYGVIDVYRSIVDRVFADATTPVTTTPYTPYASVSNDFITKTASDILAHRALRASIGDGNVNVSAVKNFPERLRALGEQRLRQELENIAKLSEITAEYKNAIQKEQRGVQANLKALYRAYARQKREISSDSRRYNDYFRAHETVLNDRLKQLRLLPRESDTSIDATRQLLEASVQDFKRLYESIDRELTSVLRKDLEEGTFTVETIAKKGLTKNLNAAQQLKKKVDPQKIKTSGAGNSVDKKIKPLIMLLIPILRQALPNLPEWDGSVDSTKEILTVVSDMSTMNLRSGKVLFKFFEKEVAELVTERVRVGAAAAAATGLGTGPAGAALSMGVNGLATAYQIMKKTDKYGALLNQMADGAETIMEMKRIIGYFQQEVSYVDILRSALQDDTKADPTVQGPSIDIEPAIMSTIPSAITDRSHSFQWSDVRVPTVTQLFSWFTSKIGSEMTVRDIIKKSIMEVKTSMQSESLSKTKEEYVKEFTWAVQKRILFGEELASMADGENMRNLVETSMGDIQKLMGVSI